MNQNEPSVAERFRAQAAPYPDSLALVAKSRRYTYAEIDRWSDAVAADLIAAGAPLSQPVAIVTRDPIALIPMAIGALKAGHFFVSIDATDPEQRIDAILAKSGAALCLSDSVTAPGGLPLVTMRELPSHAVAAVIREPHEFMQLVFTSGTTGTVKAAASRQGLFVPRATAMAAHFGRSRGERVAYVTLPGFGRATGEIFGSLINGATLCAFDARSEPLGELAETIRREAVTVLNLTPSLFRRFIRTVTNDADLASVRKLRLGADVVTLADVEAWRAHFPETSTLERSFNSTETNLVLHMSIDRNTTITGPDVPIGRPRPDVEVRLIDEAGNDVPDNEPGQLIVRSRTVARGYWNAPELTAAHFTFDPSDPERVTFRTGDLLRRDPDGLYYYVGRTDSRLKIRGRRIDPSEVENALTVHAGVREVAVVGKETRDGDLSLTAYVVVADRASLTPRDVRAALRGKVADWLVPSRIHFLDALPITRAGKVDRQALKLRPEPQLVGEIVEDPIERTLIDIWSRVIGANVGVDDDFFDDLGGESLMAAHLVTEVTRATGCPLPLSVLLELNTVSKMADYIRARHDVARTVIPLRREGTLPPLFCVSGKGGGVIAFRRLAADLGPDQPFYGLSHQGFDPAAFPRTLEAIAACYAEAIRATQSTGPYYVAGYSAGGYIAHEVARQMTAAGDTVGFLGLIDSAADPRRAPWWKRSLKYITLLRRSPLKNSVRYARALQRRGISLARAVAGKPRLAPPLPPPQVLAMRLFDSIERHGRLKPYAGRITLFRARDGFGTDSALADLGWKPLCRSLEIIDIPGEHASVLSDDVQALAEGFRRTLAAAREAAASLDTAAAHA